MYANALAVVQLRESFARIIITDGSLASSDFIGAGE
jgi:hypothetical protein